MQEKVETESGLTFIDRAIGWALPGWGSARAKARMEMSYRDGVRTRIGENYSRSLGYRFGTALDRWELMNIRDRGYQAFRANPLARTLINTETDNVIGDGANYHATSSSTAWNDEAEDRYYQWIDQADVRQLLTGSELQRTIWNRSRVGGDIGWVLVAQGADSRIQIVQAENICTPDKSADMLRIINGIQWDAIGRPQAFYILSADDRGRRQFEPVDARDFVYLPHFTDSQQARGESCYATIFDYLAHLDRFVDGVSLAAWMATVFGIVFKQKDAAKEMQGLGAFLHDSQGGQRRGLTLESGMVKYIGTEDEVAQVQAMQPVPQAPDFIRALLRLVGMPFDMPLEVLAKDMSTVNFASARIGLLPFYRASKIRFGRFATRWSRTVQWWLSREANRAHDDPKRWRTPFPVDYWSHDLYPNAWDYTDPVSEAQSDLLQMDMGTKSPQQVIKERGRDAAQILKDRRQWREKTRQLPDVRSTLSRHPQTGVGATGDPLGFEQVEMPGNKDIEPGAINAE